MLTSVSRNDLVGEVTDSSAGGVENREHSLEEADELDAGDESVLGRAPGILFFCGVLQTELSRGGVVVVDIMGCKISRSELDDN